MSNFGSLLKVYRKKRNFTQEELGKKCVLSFTQNYIFLLESGRKLPPPEKSVLALAKTLSLSEEETEKLLKAAKCERLSYAIEKNKNVEVESVAECLASNFSHEELINLTNHLQQLTAGT